MTNLTQELDCNKLNEYDVWSMWRRNVSKTLTQSLQNAKAEDQHWNKIQELLNVARIYRGAQHQIKGSKDHCQSICIETMIITFVAICACWDIMTNVLDWYNTQPSDIGMLINVTICWTKFTNISIAFLIMKKAANAISKQILDQNK